MAQRIVGASGLAGETKVEIFPKQDSINPDLSNKKNEGGYGFAIKLPFSRNLKTGNRCYFVDANGQEIQRPDILRTIRRVTEQQVNQLLGNFDPVAAKLLRYIKEPCIGIYVLDGAPEGYRGVACWQLALRCQEWGLNQDETEDLLRRWNQRNEVGSEPYEDDEVTRTVQNVYGDKFAKKKAMCKNAWDTKHHLYATCIGLSYCKFYWDCQNRKKVKEQPDGKGQRRTAREEVANIEDDTKLYREYGWQYILSPTEQILLTVCLPELEKQKGYFPSRGQTLFTSAKELAQQSGIASALEIVKGLQRFGLVKVTPGSFKPGNPKESKGTGIQRAMPIPRPPEELFQEKLKKRDKKKTDGEQKKEPPQLPPGLPEKNPLEDEDVDFGRGS
ncbi:MAG: hypothetical protein HY529_04660 [Chloroflexi bacterium]|nr:hypothetical protein [Chloroflexota bacterium]